MLGMLLVVLGVIVVWSGWTFRNPTAARTVAIVSAPDWRPSGGPGDPGPRLCEWVRSLCTSC